MKPHPFLKPEFYKKPLIAFIKYTVFFIAIVTLVVLNWKIWRKEYEQKQTIQQLKKELVVQQKEHESMSNLNNDLRRKIDSLQRGSVEMIEEEARDNFGMVGEGETFFELPEKE